MAPKVFRPLILKFGGTSVEDAAAMRRSASIVVSQDLTEFRPVVVLSACAGVTNALIQLSEIATVDLRAAEEQNKAILDRHLSISKELLRENERTYTYAKLKTLHAALGELLRGIHLLRELTDRSRDAAMAIGELASTTIFAAYLSGLSKEIPTEWIDSRTILSTNSKHTAARPDVERTTKNSSPLLKQVRSGSMIVLQGFIGGREDGITTTIGRGGSDFSAAIFGVALQAAEIQIWTDVAGILTCDPRVAPKARTIPEIRFDNASALAYFGAKVLHPETIWPAVEAGIPVRVLSSREPKNLGTVILESVEYAPVIAGIALKKDIVVIRTSPRSQLPSPRQFHDLFEAMEDYGIVPLSASTAADSAVLVVEASEAVYSLRGTIEAEADVVFEKEKCLVTLVGSGLLETPGLAAKFFGALGKENCEMISYGGRGNVISLLVDSHVAEPFVKRLHVEFFEPKKQKTSTNLSSKKPTKT